MIFNKEIFRSVAREAHQRMKHLLEEGRTPKPDGSPGYIVKLDPEHRAFKQALIVVMFSGAYFEALTYYVARQVSKSKADKVGNASYRKKLVSLGICNDELLQAAEAFRADRNDLVHEKAIPATDLNWEKARFAESCADRAIEFVASVERLLVKTPLLSGSATSQGSEYEI